MLRSDGSVPGWHLHCMGMEAEWQGLQQQAAAAYVHFLR